MGAGASASNDGGADVSQQSATPAAESAGESRRDAGDGPPKPKVAEGWGGTLDKEDADEDEGDADGTTMIVGKLPDEKPQGTDLAGSTEEVEEGIIRGVAPESIPRLKPVRSFIA